MAQVTAEEQVKPERVRVATFLNWCVFIAVVCVLFRIAVAGYFAEHGVPQWLWDIYDWKVWPLSPFRQWRNSL